ncbi:conserved hypothetical protein [Novosphingobium sp. 9U]|nr:conserved hypothetical protein [Novosphingobium sp. 9U]
MALAAAPQPQLEAFEAALASRDSATLALEQWCAAQHIAEPAQVHAENLGASGEAPPHQLRRRFGLTQDETISLRHVRLSCGDVALSVAWNWYVPERLTPEMRDVLRTTDMPFGKVVAPLQFRREPLATTSGRAENCPADTISTHRARLVLRDGRPLAYLIECYTAANLAMK